ncbi:acyl carrier protein [Actinomyces wuliandei]|uniref:acyl carrier protein n=1 Tax=Actinomyces wuliandei TaxID=2057743 RepID=UPI000FD73624|nr:acyl carrier protein [Actinomyces wuliandei]
MTSSTSNEIRDAISEIVVEELELDIEVDELDPHADLIDEYGADSLGLIQVLAQINKTLGIRVPREEAADLRTLDLLVAKTVRLQAEQGSDK